MTRKRIAVCMSGQLRTWKKTHESWLPFIKNQHQVDVFVHTWDFNTVSAKISHDDATKSRISKKDLEEFSNTVKPCAMLVEEQRTFTPSSSFQAMQNPAHLSQFYGIMMASRLKQHHEASGRFVYDTVIRLRPDLWFSDDPIKMISDAKEGSFNGFGLNWQGFNAKISDMFWISNSHLHDVIADSFLNLQTIESKEFSTDACEPENVLFFNLKRNSIPVVNHNWCISIMRNSQQDAANLHGPRKDVW